MKMLLYNWFENFIYLEFYGVKEVIIMESCCFSNSCFVCVNYSITNKNKILFKTKFCNILLHVCKLRTIQMVFAITVLLKTSWRTTHKGFVRLSIPVNESLYSINSFEDFLFVGHALALDLQGAFSSVLD